jgi:hypothetical protein
MSRKAPDWTRLRSQTAPYVLRSATPRREGDGAPFAGAPGWYVVRRKPRISVLLHRVLSRRRRLGLLSAAGAGGLVVLAVLLLRPYWGEAGVERSAPMSRPPGASSPDRMPDESTTASAEAPPVSQAPAQIARGDASLARQDRSRTEATRAKRDPAPPQGAAAVARRLDRIDPAGAKSPRRVRYSCAITVAGEGPPAPQASRAGFETNPLLFTAAGGWPRRHGVNGISAARRNCFLAKSCGEDCS